MQPKVSKGLATWAGLVAAVGQYAAAVAVFLDDPEKATALGPLTTATVTLVVVVYGRMMQARDVTREMLKPVLRPPVFKDPVPGALYSESGVQLTPGYAGSEPRPHARVDWQKVAQRMADDPDPDPPAGPSTRFADDAELDDPGYVPSRAEHSRLKG